MQLNLASLAASALALASTAAADRMIVFKYCFFSCSSPATWISAYGEYHIDGGNGCRKPEVPAMRELCVDEKHARAHFYFDNQPKRCLKETSNDFQTCSDDFKLATCSTVYYDEVPCTW